MVIDLVIPFVNMADEIWAAKYRENVGKTIEPFKYRTNDLFKYFWRGIEKFMPWLNNIYLILDSESQIPEWLNLDAPKLHIIYHRDFIPAEYLPTFNACTIELFQYRIPGLSEHYIVANDDFFAVGPLAESDFFDLNTGKPKITFVPGHILGTNTGVVRPWTAFTLRQYQEFVDPNATTCIRRPGHNFTAHTKSIWTTLFSLYEDKFLESITPITDAKNYNQYAACFYGLSHDLVINNPSGLQEGLFSYSTNWAGIIKYDLFNNLDRKVICINDTSTTGQDEIHPMAARWIKEALEFRVDGSNSSFEKNLNEIIINVNNNDSSDDDSN